MVKEYGLRVNMICPDQEDIPGQDRSFITVHGACFAAVSG